MSLALKLFILTMALPVASFAQNRVGNGGNGVVCRTNFDQKISKAILLDLYESTSPLPSAKRTQEQVLTSVLDKLQTVSPEQAAIYRRRAEEMKKEIDYVSSRKLASVDDSKHLIRPTEKDCGIEQVAIRKNLVLEGEKRFLVSQEIWDKMDENSKAGLILHEVVYEHLWKLGEDNSVKARHLVAFYLSEDFQKIGKDEYWKRIQKLKVPLYR